MFEQITLKDVLDLGMQGVLLVFVGALWQRLNKVTDAFIEDRQQAAAERQVIAQAYGVTPDELATMARKVRILNDKSSG